MCFVAIFFCNWSFLIPQIIACQFIRHLFLIVFKHQYFWCWFKNWNLCNVKLFLSLLDILSRHWFSVINPRPSQHGVDLLSLLSKLLDQNTKPGEAGNDPSVVVVSMTLKALQELCKAEVICCMNPCGTFSTRDILDKHECIRIHLSKKIWLIPPRDLSMVNCSTNHTIPFSFSWMNIRCPETTFTVFRWLTCALLGKFFQWN